MKKKEKLGLFMLIALVTGNMVGSGAFMLPTNIARIGSIGLLSLVFTAVGAMCLALVFAKMSLLVPKAGGPYAYARAGFGEYIGFQTAYYYWVAVWVSNAAIVVALLGYLNVFFPIASHPVAKIITIMLVIWIPTVVNIVGVRSAGALQVITTILKFVPLLIVATIGWFYFHPEYISQSFNLTAKSNFSAFSSAAALTLWLFIGVESATIPSEAVKNPHRNIPLATLLGTLIAAIIYIVSFVAIAGMLPAEVLANSSSPFAAATEVIFGKWGRLLVAAGAVIACFGALNGWVLLSAQVPMAAAKDNLFPEVFAKCNKRTGVPVNGLVISSTLTTVIMLVMADLDLIKQFELIITVTVTASLVAYFYTAIAEIVVLPKQQHINRKNVFHICVAILAAIYSFWAIFGSDMRIIFYLMSFILSSFPFYAWFQWKKKSSIIPKIF
jgi:basic amino acid/polyamine antiporter, APA family